MTWENTLADMRYKHGKLDHDSADAEDYVVKEYEVALKHPVTGAVVKLTDDGYINVFASDKAGVRIDPYTQSTTLFGETVNVIANDFNIRTNPYGFNWNGRAFNPKLYGETSYLDSHNDTDHHHSYSVMTKPVRKVRYSEGLVDIMQSFGLPVDYIEEGDF